MRAGKLNSRVEFYTYTQVADGYGGNETTRSTIKTTNAEVKPLGQIRTQQANQTDLVGGYEILTRYRRDFIPLKTMFIKYGNIDLTITSVSQSEEDRQMYSLIAMVKK